MNIRKSIYLIITILATALLYSCSNEGGKVIDEGKIIYYRSSPNTWEANKQNENLVYLFPKEIPLFFKNNNTALHINGDLGIFKFKYISDYESGKNYSIMNLGFGTAKLMNVADSSEFAFGYSQMNDMKITNTSDTMTICGYLCKKAIVECPQIDIKFDVWYTPNIKIKNPNTNTPFKNIPGVPLKFDLIIHGFYMNFEAVAVEYSKVDDSVFEIPDYPIATKAEMNTAIHELLRK